MSVFINIAAYKFASLGNLEALQADLRAMCIQAGLRGTILLSPEGINLFVSARARRGSTLATLNTVPGLADLPPKVSLSAYQPFNRMLVKIKKDHRLRCLRFDPARRPGPRLPPACSSSGSTKAAPSLSSTPATTTK